MHRQNRFFVFAPALSRFIHDGGQSLIDFRSLNDLMLAVFISSDVYAVVHILIESWNNQLVNAFQKHLAF